MATARLLAAIGLTATLFLAEAGAQTALPLKAARWIAPGSDPVRALGSAPTECLARGGDGYLIEIGRAAFRTPLLLGGQAARAGLSCESCHRGGRSNPDFLFPGASGAPGTADVTLSLFSSRRGDGIANPRPIPDLSGPAESLKVARSPRAGELESFIRGLVVEEFDGAEPSSIVLSGLAAYVRSLSPDACPSAASEPLRAGRLVEEASRAVRAGIAALGRGDRDAALLVIAAARSQLELIYERYDTADLAAERELLVGADRQLAVVLAAIRARQAGVEERLSAWLTQSQTWSARVEGAEQGSLFRAARLTTR
jgi:hypothetical protein